MVEKDFSTSHAVVTKSKSAVKSDVENLPMCLDLTNENMKIEERKQTHIY